MSDRDMIEQALHELAKYYIELNRQDNAALEAKAQSDFEKKYKELEDLGGPLFFKDRFVQKINELRPSEPAQPEPPQAVWQRLSAMLLKVIAGRNQHISTITQPRVTPSAIGSERSCTVSSARRRFSCKKH